MERLRSILFRQVNIAFLVYFRIFAGFLIAGEVFNQFLTEDFQAFYEPDFHFTYLVFPFQIILDQFQAALLMSSIIVLGILVALGWQYRVTSILFFIAHSFFFLIEKAEYVNHFYLYVLITFILIIVPAEKAFSLDSKRTGERKKSVDAWIYYLLIIHISIVYFYASVAKMHTDWYEARALKVWLGYMTDNPVFGELFKKEAAPYIWAYFGLLFDLLVVPGMLWKRSRNITFVFVCLFHLTNVIVFGLATFPWFSIMMTFLYFGPSAPAKLPIFKKYFSKEVSFPVDQSHKKLKFIHYFLGVYVLAQLLLPFRHWLYPGSPNWTEEGHKFSWHMMLRTKLAITRFNVHYNDHMISLDGTRHLSKHAKRVMGGNPEMILEYAHFLGEEYRKLGYDNVKVYATALVSLNGRQYHPMVDQKVDLLQERRGIHHYDWILPLED